MCERELAGGLDSRPPPLRGGSYEEQAGSYGRPGRNAFHSDRVRVRLATRQACLAHRAGSRSHTHAPRVPFGPTSQQTITESPSSGTKAPPPAVDRGEPTCFKLVPSHSLTVPSVPADHIESRSGGIFVPSAPVL